MANRKIFANQGPTDPNLRKSTFDLSYKSNGTYRFGRIYPVSIIEAPANSSYNMGINFAYDMDPLVFPIQTNVRCHVMSFKVPMRILWKNFKNFFGQVGSDGVINGQNSYKMPYIKRPTGWVTEGSLADYMGLPTSRIDNVQLPYSLHPFIAPSYHSSVYWQGNYYILTQDSAVDNNATITAFSLSRGHNIINSSNKTFTLKAYCPDNFNIKSANVTLRLYDNCSIVQGKYEKYIANSSRDVRGYYYCGGQFLSKSIVASISQSVRTFGNRNYYEYSVSFKLDDVDLTALNSHLANNNVTMVLEYTDVLAGIMHNRSTGFYDITASRSVGNEQNPETGVTTEINAADFKLGSSQFALGQYGLYDLHYTCLQPAVGTSTIFDSVNGSDPKLPINALPFRAYEFIYRYFFENQRVTPFYKDGKPVYNEFLSNDGDGADETTPVDFFRAPYEYDMFTTCVPTPFYGNAPLVGVSSNGDNTATFNMVDTATNTPYNLKVTTEDGSDKITGISFADKDAKTSTLAALEDAISFGISIADFRNINALTKFQERYMKAGTKYQNLVYEFFGTNPPIGEEFPVYLGGVTRNISVDKITNTAQSEGNPLGDFAGQAIFRGSSKRIKCFCSEPSYIITIMYFSVTPTYSQMLPKHFTKSRLLDYYNPLFANISPQPVMCYELAPLQLTDAQLHDTFGYNRPYADYVSRQDEVHGEFRSSRANFILQRRFGSKPVLNKNFLEIDPAQLTDIFSYTEDTDKIFGQIGFDIKAKLPIPKFSVPTII